MMILWEGNYDHGEAVESLGNILAWRYYLVLIHRG